MGTRDTRVDAYIAKSAEFAKPVLKYIRQTVHGACPDCTETIKWGMPHFEHHGTICHMAAFKQHCALGFYRQRAALGLSNSTAAMGQFGRITKVSDLPSRTTLIRYIRTAARLNEQGGKAVRAPRRRVSALVVPPDLAAALRKHRKAQATFASFPPSQRREYIQWITDAKREETRQRRLRTTLAWLAEGKTHNWRYERRRA